MAARQGTHHTVPCYLSGAKYWLHRYLLPGKDWAWILGLSAQMIVITLGLAVCTPLCLLSGCGWVVMVMVVWTVWTVWAPSGPGSCVLAAAVCRCESDSVPSSWLVSYSDTLTSLLQDICPPTVM